MYPTRRGNVEFRPNPTFIFQDTFVEGTESTDITDEVDCNETESEEEVVTIINTCIFVQ